MGFGGSILWNVVIECDVVECDVVECNSKKIFYQKKRMPFVVSSTSMLSLKTPKQPNRHQRNRTTGVKRRKRSKIPKHQMPLVTGYDSSSDEEEEEKKNVAPKISSKKKKNTYVVSSLKLSSHPFNTHTPNDVFAARRRRI